MKTKLLLTSLFLNSTLQAATHIPMNITCIESVDSLPHPLAPIHEINLHLSDKTQRLYHGTLSVTLSEVKSEVGQEYDVGVSFEYGFDGAYLLLANGPQLIAGIVAQLSDINGKMNSVLPAKFAIVKSEEEMLLSGICKFE